MTIRGKSDSPPYPGHYVDRPTVLIRMSPELVKVLEQEYVMEGGSRIQWDFGKPGPDGFHTATVMITTPEPRPWWRRLFR